MSDPTSKYIDELRSLESSQWPAYLSEHSGLPGPRANLPLAAAVAACADVPEIRELLRNGGEYQTMCAAAALGRHADTAASEAQARALASDPRWRVQEGVAIGLQLLGDVDPEAIRRIVRQWVDVPEPLVQRAAAAAICEPRLLRSSEGAAVASDVCSRATQHLAGLPAQRRKEPDARKLRQALGYCWSVAVAANPQIALSSFQELDTTNPDIAWIVNQNRRKKRLSSLL